MMLLCAFDLPRETKEERKAANKYRKRLVELGFAMKQFSLYEREVRHIDVKNRWWARGSGCAAPARAGLPCLPPLSGSRSA